VTRQKHFVGGVRGFGGEGGVRAEGLEDVDFSVDVAAFGL
jgi:hypothetical protein